MRNNGWKKEKKRHLKSFDVKTIKCVVGKVQRNLAPIKFDKIRNYVC